MMWLVVKARASERATAVPGTTTRTVQSQASEQSPGKYTVLSLKRMQVYKYTCTLVYYMAI